MPKNYLPEFYDKPLRQISSFLPNFFSNPWSNFEDLLPQEMTSKGVQIYEDDSNLHVEVPLPGLNLDDIEVNLNNGVLFVTGESSEKEQDSKKKFYRASKRNYSYSLTLPTQIDENQEPQAVYKDGVLNISLKLAKQNGKKKIKVKSGNGK